MAKEDAPDLTTHPVIARMLSHPEKPTKAVVLVGYLGPSQKAGHVRLHAHLDLDNYLEIPTKSIIHSEAVSKSDTTSPTRLVVCAKAHIQPVQNVEASFLQGPIASAYTTKNCAPVMFTTKNCDLLSYTTKNCEAQPLTTRNCDQPGATTKNCDPSA